MVRVKYGATAGIVSVKKWIMGAGINRGVNISQ